MFSFPPTLPLPNNTFLILRDLIHEHTGLFYEANKREVLAEKLSARVLELGFGSFLDYYYLLKYDSPPAEWQALMDLLTVQETYFCREMGQIQAIVDVVVPQWVAAHPDQPLQIWSAACATGEEPLSLAMALDAAGWFGRLPITILGSDASPAAISKARRGLYRERSFRQLPPALQERYFSQQADGWQIVPSLHAHVSWAVINLLNAAEVAHPSRAPIIFCRNAFIYFSTEAIKKTVAYFAQGQPTPGYLLVAASESLFRATAAYTLDEIGGAFMYVKQVDQAL